MSREEYEGKISKALEFYSKVAIEIQNYRENREIFESGNGTFLTPGYHAKELLEIHAENKGELENVGTDINEIGELFGPELKKKFAYENT